MSLHHSVEQAIWTSGNVARSRWPFDLMRVGVQALYFGSKPISMDIAFNCYHICNKVIIFWFKANMFAFTLKSPAGVIGDLAARMKRRRIDANLTQRDLAEKSGVSYGSLRLFEEKGKISLEALVKIAFILGAESEFENLFPPRPKRTIDEIVGQPMRQRVRKK